MKVSKWMVAAAASFALIPKSFAGSSNIDLECKSASGRTVVSANVPGDNDEHTVVFRIDGQEKKYESVVLQFSPYSMRENSWIKVDGSARKGDFTFSVFDLWNGKRGDYLLFSFKEIAKSARVRKTANGQRGTFSAVVQGIDPRAPEGSGARGGDVISKEITVDCTYRWEI